MLGVPAMLLGILMTALLFSRSFKWWDAMAGPFLLFGGGLLLLAYALRPRSWN